MRRAAAITTAIFGLIALAVAMGIGRFAFTPLLPMMQDDAGVSVAAGGWLASANYLGYLLGASSAVGLRLRAHHAARIGLMVIALTTLGMGLVDGFAAWAILRTLAGIASAWVFIYASAWCLESLAELRRSVLSGVVFGGVGIGIAITGTACVALMVAGASAAQAWIVLGGLALALSVMIWSAFESPAAPAPPAARPAGDIFRSGESLRLALCYWVFGFSYIIPATFLPLMAKQAISDPAVFGWSWPVFGLAAFASTLAASALQQSLGNRRLWALGHLLMAIGIALPVIWAGIVPILLAALLVGGTFMVITMAAIREARDTAGPHATTLIAVMTTAFAIGQILGPISVSAILNVGGGFSAALLIASTLLIVSAGVLWRLPPMTESVLTRGVR